MANSKHLAELKKGIKNWNRWRRENPGIIPDLRKADLRKFDLSFVNFRDAKLAETRFSGACLRSANLSKADLSFSRLIETNLKFANLNSSNLSQATLIKANLIEADLMKADLSEANLREANLSKANLRFTQLFKANLAKADLSLAVVKKAQLQNTDMTAVRGLGSDFTEANLTGACLYNWNIDLKTNFESVECDYVYRKRRYGSEFVERYPRDKNFEPGEFTKEFQKVSEMRELFFENGITEFFEYLEEQQNKYTNEVITIEEIEPKGDNALVVRLETLPKADQDDPERFNQEQFQLAIANYELQAREQAIELHEKHNAQMVELFKLVATKQSVNVNVENTSMSNSPEFNNNNNFHGAVGNFANQVNDNARQQTNQYNYDSDNKIIPDTGKELKSLLEQLSQTNPTDNTQAKLAVANLAIEHIDSNPALNKRVVSALKAGSISALAQFINHPISSFFISALEDWQKTRM